MQVFVVVVPVVNNSRHSSTTLKLFLCYDQRQHKKEKWEKNLAIGYKEMLLCLIFLQLPGIIQYDSTVW